MSKWYEIIWSKGMLSVEEKKSNYSSQTFCTLKWENYRDSCTRKTRCYLLSLYINDIGIPLEVNGWRLSKPILSELRKWHNGTGKHSFYEINITSVTEGDKTFRFYTEYGEQELINSIVKTLEILLMCKSTKDFDKIFCALKNKDNIYDWRAKLSADLSCHLIHAIKNADLNINAFSVHKHT